MCRLIHKVAQRRSATLLQDNPRENRDNQLDCPITNTVCNDEALTSGGERFVSSSTNPDRVTHDLGLGKAIVVHSARFERTTFGSASQRSIQLSYECIPGKQMLPRPNYKVHWMDTRSLIIVAQRYVEGKTPRPKPLLQPQINNQALEQVGFALAHW